MEDAVSTVSIWLDESGDTRVESLGTITIIKPEAGMIYSPQPDGQTFARPITDESAVGNSTDFLDNIRTFQGNADLLTESRVIEGISAVGYELEGDAGTDILWVDPTDGTVTDRVAIVGWRNSEHHFEVRCTTTGECIRYPG